MQRYQVELPLQAEGNQVGLGRERRIVESWWWGMTGHAGIMELTSLLPHLKIAPVHTSLHLDASQALRGPWNRHCLCKWGSPDWGVPPASPVFTNGKGHSMQKPASNMWFCPGLQQNSIHCHYQRFLHRTQIKSTSPPNTRPPSIIPPPPQSF